MSKVSIPREILKFMVDKTADFLISRICDKMSRNNTMSPNIEFSNIEFEKNIRNEIALLDNKVANLEAVVFQSKRLFQDAIYYIMNTNNNNIHGNTGDINIIINITYASDDDIQNNEMKYIPQNILKKIVTDSAENLFVESNENIATEYIEVRISDRCKVWVSNANEKIKNMREGK